MKIKLVFILFLILLILMNFVSADSQVSKKDIKRYLKVYFEEYISLIEENIPLEDRDEIYFYNNLPYDSVVFISQKGLAVGFQSSKRENVIVEEVNLTHIGLLFINELDGWTILAPLGDHIIEKELRGLMSLYLRDDASFFLANNELIYAYGGVYLENSSKIYIQDSWIIKASNLKEDWSEFEARKDANVSFWGDVKRYNLTLSYKPPEYVIKIIEENVPKYPDRDQKKIFLTIWDITGYHPDKNIFDVIWNNKGLFVLILVILFAVILKAKYKKPILKSFYEAIFNRTGISHPKGINNIN